MHFYLNLSTYELKNIRAWAAINYDVGLPTIFEVETFDDQGISLGQRKIFFISDTVININNMELLYFPEENGPNFYCIYFCSIPTPP